MYDDIVLWTEKQNEKLKAIIGEILHHETSNGNYRFKCKFLKIVGSIFNECYGPLQMNPLEYNLKHALFEPLPDNLDNLLERIVICDEEYNTVTEKV